MNVALAAKRYSEYASAWSNDASFFEREGLYEWMESKISDYKFVLEVGCGVGHSTETLLRKGHRVIAVEENPTCLYQANERLRKKYQVLKIKRSQLLSSGPDYAVKYGPISKPARDVDVILLDGNLLLGDEHLFQFLGMFEFDAVLCWLIGTTGHLVANSLNMESMRGCSPAEYRLRVQNRLFDEAYRWLRNAGVLHIVDRGEFTLMEDLIQDAVGSYVAQADGTSFTVQVESFDQVKYDAGVIGSGIKMGLSPGSSGRVPVTYEHGLHSILAKIDKAIDTPPRECDSAEPPETRS